MGIWSLCAGGKPVDMFSNGSDSARCTSSHEPKQPREIHWRKKSGRTIEFWWDQLTSTDGCAPALENNSTIDPCWHRDRRDVACFGSNNSRHNRLRSRRLRSTAPYSAADRSSCSPCRVEQKERVWAEHLCWAPRVRGVERSWVGCSRTQVRQPTTVDSPLVFFWAVLAIL
jgi:hypothetical protein